MKKCDTCKHMKFYDSGPIKKIDDISFHYCEREHWEFDEELDFGTSEEMETVNETIDIWSDCKDYQEKEK